MSQIKSIFFNTSWMTVSQIVNSICAFLWTIIIANYLGVSDYGIISFAISYNVIIGIVMDLGISSYITREIAKEKDLVYKIMNNFLLFKIILSVVLLVLSGVMLYILGYSQIAIVVTLIFTFESIFMSLSFFINGIFQAFEKVKYQAIANILNSLLLLIGILITIIFDLGIYAIAISYTLGYFAYFTYMFFNYVQKFGIPRLQFDLNYIKLVTISSIPFGLALFFNTVYFSIDMVMLSYLSGDYPTGIYKSAYNILTVFTAFFAVYQNVFFPVMSKFFKESKDLLKVSYELSVKYLLLIILPLSVGIFFYARPLVDLIYNNQYSIASVPVQILIWTVSFLFVNGAASTLLNSIDKEKTVTKIYIIAVMFNIALNLILIPSLGYNGAAIATVLSEVLIFALTLYQVFKTDYKPDINLLKTAIKLIICSVVLAILLYYLNISMWLAIPIGIFVYLILLLLTKSIDENDKFILKEIIRK